MKKKFATIVKTSSNPHRTTSKMILQKKIKQEMQQYQDDMKWEEYRNNKILEGIEIGYLQN